MITVSNLQDKYLIVSSDLLKDFFTNIQNYKTLKVLVRNSCCDSNYEEIEIDTKPISEGCTICNYQYAFRADVTDIAFRNIPITELYVKNIVTGQEYNVLAADIEFDVFLEVCRDGSCKIESLPDYSDKLFNIINNWFSDNVLYNSVVAGYCGNTITICNLPQNFIVTKLVTANGEEKYFNFNNTDEYIITNENIMIPPFLFESSKFEDGVYEVVVQVQKENGEWLEQNNCFFLDNYTKCKVSRYIENFLTNYEDSTYVHIIHYALVNASNCHYNCKDLCELYKHLLKLLDNTINTQDCGC